MVETIAPVVHGGRNRRYWAALAIHVCAATLGGALFGAVLGLAGGLVGAPFGAPGLIAVAVVAALYAAREAFGLPVPLPDLDRQVPDWWRTFYSPNVAAGLYGLGLGIGFLTFLTYGTYAAVAVGAFVSGSPLGAAVLLGSFGLARSAAVAIGAFPRRAHEPESWPAEVVERLSESRPRRTAALLNAGVLLTILTAALIQLL